MRAMPVEWDQDRQFTQMTVHCIDNYILFCIPYPALTNGIKRNFMHHA